MTSLKLSSSEPSSQDSLQSFNLARNIFTEFTQDSVSSIDTIQDLGPVSTYSMVKLGLERKVLKPKRNHNKKKYPQRNKTSPVKWWLGERPVYNEQGFLIAKDIRR